MSRRRGWSGVALVLLAVVVVSSSCQSSEAGRGEAVQDPAHATSSPTPVPTADEIPVPVEPSEPETFAASDAPLDPEALGIDVARPVLDFGGESDGDGSAGDVVSWFLGETTAADPACGAKTLYQEGPDGFERVIADGIELDTVTQVVASSEHTSQYWSRGVRAIALGVECPVAYAGKQLWLGSFIEVDPEFRAIAGRPPEEVDSDLSDRWELHPQLILDGGVAEVLWVDFDPSDPSAPYRDVTTTRIRVAMADGTNRTVVVTPRAGGWEPYAVTVLDDPQWPLVPPGELNPVGSAVELRECFFLERGRWRFTADIELPDGVDEATFFVRYGFTDYGPLQDNELNESDVVTVSASGEITLSATHDPLFDGAPRAPLGVRGDRTCFLAVVDGQNPEWIESTMVGPTSAEVPAPRPSVAGQLPPGPNAPPVRDVEVMGWLDLPVVVGSRGGWTDQHRVFEPGTIGPAKIRIDGVSYDIGSEVPLGRHCEFSSCFAFAGLDPAGDIEWLTLVDRPQAKRVRWMPMIDIIDDHAIFGYGIWMRLPLAEFVNLDCSDAGLVFTEPWLPHDLHYVVDTEVSVNTETFEIAKMTCRVRPFTPR